MNKAKVMSDKEIAQGYGCKLCHCCNKKAHDGLAQQLAERDATICGMREALTKAREWINWPWAGFEKNKVGRMTPSEILSVIAKALVPKGEVT